MSDPAAGRESASTPLDPDTLRQLCQGLKTGIAVVEPGTWKLVFENATFFKWFPPGAGEDESLPSRVPGFKAETALARAKDGRAHAFETESHESARKIPVSVELRPIGGQAGQAGGLLVVECHDISKQKQAEYMLASYSELAEKNARDLQREKERAEKLLLNIMPRSVYEEMKDYGTVTPQLFNDASIMMLDFVGSTQMAVSSDPVSLIGELNDMFLVFDRIADQFGCERIRTVGDAYVAVSGLPEPNREHAANVARLALRILRYIERRNAAHPEAWQCRIGINSGPVIGSLVGVQKYVYDIFGPGINLAARMEALSDPMRITVSHQTHDLLKDDFALTPRGTFDVKGFGSLDLYFLERELPRPR